jgi:hypothetical protein
MSVFVPWFLLVAAASALDAPEASRPPKLLEEADFRQPAPDPMPLHGRWLGPFIETYQPGTNGDGFTAFLRPLFSIYADEDGKQCGWDLLWPLAGQRISPTERRLYFWPFYNRQRFTGGQTSKTRHGIFPLFCHGTREDGSPYTVFFPVAGELPDFLGYDEIDFIHFPLWVRFTKGQTISNDWLWPIFSRTQGPTTRKWRVWPLYGQAETAFGSQHFLLWPFIHYGRENPAPVTRKTATNWFVFPLAGHRQVRSAAGQPIGSSWTCLWPFFSGDNLDDPRGGYLHRLSCPKPFFERLSDTRAASTREKTSLWPLWGRDTSREATAHFVLWPLYLDHQTTVGNATTSSRRILIFWEDRRRQEANATISERSGQLWPLISWKNRLDAHTCEFSLLSPSLGGPNPPAVLERNWSPLWTLYRQASAPGEIHQDLLWGLWERRSSPSRQRIAAPFFRLETIPGDQAGNGATSDLSLFWGAFRKTESETRLFWFLKWPAQ